MREQIDDSFYDRAEEFIALANKHMTKEVPSKVSASMNWSAARFAAWLATAFEDTAATALPKREEAIEFFTEQFREMFTTHFDAFVQDHDQIKVKTDKPQTK